MAKGLGRGFESLIPTDIVEDDFDITLSEDSSKSQLTELNLTKIMPETDQPRKDFSEEALAALADSIREHGVLQPIVVVAEGFVQAGAALIGGETAEMPGMYGEDDYDLAGFAVGVAEKSQIIDGSKVAAGHVLLGLASSGIHSNGYSLVRRVFADYTGEEVLPELEGKKLKDVLLEPTRIYVKAALPLIKEELVNGIAHITGGGFIENVPRMFSDDLAAEIDESKVPVLPIFKALEKYGQIKHEEMFEIFNMGIGLMLAVKPENVERVKELLDEPVYEIGRIVKKDGASVVIK